MLMADDVDGTVKPTILSHETKSLSDGVNGDR